MKKIVLFILALAVINSTMIASMSMTTSAAAATTYSAKDNVNYFKLNGRANLVSDGIAMDYSGDGVEWTANCSGNVSLTFSSMYKENYFACWIDGVRVGGGINYSTTDPTADATSGRLQPISNNESFTDSTLKITSTPLSAGMHTFKIAKIAQVIPPAQSGAAVPNNLLTLKSVEMTGSFGTKPANKTGYIEFIGDSITAGLGILTHNLYDPLRSNYSDPTLAYAWQVADAFDADRSLVCAGGIGLGAGAVRGNGPWRQTDCYQYTCAFRNKTDSGLYRPVRTPNVVVVNLGTNDWFQLNGYYSTGTIRPTLTSYVDINGTRHECSSKEESLDKAVETVKEAYKKLTNQIRSFYGNVPIVYCTGMMNISSMKDTNSSTIEGLYNQAVAESGMTNTYFVRLQSCKSNGNYGMDVGGADHPFYTSHVKNAQILINFINGKGWMNTTPIQPSTQQTQPTTTPTKPTTVTTPSTPSTPSTQPTTTTPAQPTNPGNATQSVFLDWSKANFSSVATTKETGSFGIKLSGPANNNRYINTWSKNYSNIDALEFTVTPNSSNKATSCSVGLGSDSNQYSFAIGNTATTVQIPLSDYNITGTDFNLYIRGGAVDLTISNVIAIKYGSTQTQSTSQPSSQPTAPSSQATEPSTAPSSQASTANPVVFDPANPTVYPRALRSAAWNVNSPSSYIVDGFGKKVLKITRNNEYDNISAQFITDLSSIAPKATKFNIWLAGDADANLTAGNAKGGFSVGFSTSDNEYYGLVNGTDCVYTINAEGGTYSIDLASAKFRKLTVNTWQETSARFNGVADWNKTYNFSEFASKINSVILNFCSIKNIPNQSAYLNKSYYVGEFGFEGNFGSTTPTTQPSSQPSSQPTSVPSTAYTVKINGVAVENNGSEFTFPVSTKKGFIAYTDGANYYDVNDKVSINKNLEFTSVAIGEVKMLEGASIRLAQRSGIRFETKVDTAKLGALPNTAKVEKGTLITLKELATSDLTLDSTYQTVNVKYTSNSYRENGTFAGSIVNIQEHNIAKEFLGRGYVKVTVGDITKTIYADYADGDIANNTRSVAFIANAYKTNSADLYNKLDTAHKELVDKWISKYN